MVFTDTPPAISNLASMGVNDWGQCLATPRAKRRARALRVRVQYLWKMLFCTRYFENYCSFFKENLFFLFLCSKHINYFKVLFLNNVLRVRVQDFRKVAHCTPAHVYNACACGKTRVLWLHARGRILIQAPLTQVSHFINWLPMYSEWPGQWRSIRKLSD